MKLDIIPENERELHEKVGLVFFGKASELKDAIDILAGRCPDCGGVLFFHYYTNPVDEFGSEMIPYAEQCNCGYSWKYTEEPQSKRWINEMP